MKKKKKIEIILGFLFLFTIVFFTLSPVQIPQGITGLTIFSSQPDGTNGTDTLIREDFPDANSPRLTELSIGKTLGNSELRALLQFNISPIPQTDTILNATVQVYLKTVTGRSNITVKAYRLTSEWIETKASWNNRIGSSSWSSVGGDYDPIELSTQVFLNSSEDYYNFTITELTRNWVNGNYNNYGIILIASNVSAGNFSKISSSDSTTASQRPQIIIEHIANVIPTAEIEQGLTIHSFDESVNLIKNVMKKVTIEIKNTREVELTDITLDLEDLEDAYYLITPLTIPMLKPGEIKKFEISLLIKDFIGEKETAYIITAGNITFAQPLTLNVMNFQEYYLEETEKLLERIANIKIITMDETILTELKECETKLSLLSTNVKAENFIEAEDNLKQTSSCIDDVEEKLKHPTIIIELGKYWLWIITWILILILIIVLIIIIYILYKKFSILSFLKQRPESSAKNSAFPKSGLIDERLKKIKEKLGD